MVSVFVHAPVDYVMGHLRYGHYEGYIDMSEEEYEEFEKDPMDWIKKNDGKEYLTLEVDDWRIKDVGDITEVETKVYRTPEC